ncbi:MAG: hypothetical protein IJE17_09310 [Clostridia bacterium]|nr:hypothetical protein [Clostridia bacterium]
MYELKNGILYQDGKPIIAMGQSYYPSFHEAKYPAPPSGDRVGLMKEDIKWMREVGFQFLRVAAIGNVTLDENDQVKVDTPFVDEMLKEAHDKGFATSVRLQGYVMNMRGHKDYLMRNHKDEPMELDWSAFMQSSLYHKGVLQDNIEASQALARHFDKIPGVLSYQIYNEPHYPYNGIFDYHPATIAAYQDWRKENGMEPEDPPRRRPLDGESPEPWIQWRLFNMYAMSKFLNDTAALTRKAAPDKETYTCMTSAPAGNGPMAAGINYYDNAEGMETVGITSYTHQEGVDYYVAAYQYNMTECAAALNGKHAWTIEIDARTHMPARKLHEETYHLLGAGHKGIVYYEWRGDYPDEKTPLPDNCGFIFNDGTKTEHYDRSVEMVRFVNKHSTLLASAECMRDAVGLLSSDHAAAYADAYMGDENISAYVHQSLQAYRELRKAHINPAILCSRHLKENKLGVKYLFIPCQKNWLSKQEMDEIDAFVAAGGKAFFLNQMGTFGAVTPYGWWQWDVERLNGTTSEFRSNMELEDALELCRIKPLAAFNSRHLKAGLLRGADYTLAVINNTDPAHRDVEGAVLTLSFPVSSARFLSPDVEMDLECDGTSVKLPAICEGGIVVMKD